MDKRATIIGRQVSQGIPKLIINAYEGYEIKELEAPEDIYIDEVFNINSYDIEEAQMENATRLCIVPVGNITNINPCDIDGENILLLAVNLGEYFFKEIGHVLTYPTNEDVEKVKDELLLWCRRHGLPYIKDIGNFDGDYALDIKKFIKYMINLYRFFSFFDAIDTNSFENIKRVKLNKIIDNNNKLIEIKKLNQKEWIYDYIMEEINNIVNNCVIKFEYNYETEKFYMKLSDADFVECAYYELAQLFQNQTGVYKKCQQKDCGKYYVWGRGRKYCEEHSGHSFEVARNRARNKEKNKCS